MGGSISAKTWLCHMMSSQSRNEIWAVRAGICEIAIWCGGRSAKTWSAKCWDLRVGSCQSRNLWNCCLMGRVDLPTSGLPNDKFSFVRARICEITIGWAGRSARTWSAKWWALRVGMKYELSEQKSEIAILMWGFRSAKTWSVKCWALRVGSCQSRNLWNCHLRGVG